MKVRFVLAVMAALALSIGRAHATPQTVTIYETTQGFVAPWSGGTVTEVTPALQLPGDPEFDKYQEGFYVVLEKGTTGVTAQNAYQNSQYWSDVLYVKDIAAKPFFAQYWSDPDQPGVGWSDYTLSTGTYSGNPVFGTDAGASLTSVINGINVLQVAVEGPPSLPLHSVEGGYDTQTTFVDSYGNHITLHSDSTPEPATLFLLGTGALFGVLLRRKKAA